MNGCISIILCHYFQARVSQATWPGNSDVRQLECTLGARGFSCAVSVTDVKSFSRAFSHGFTACFFGKRPKTCQTVADKAP